MSLVDPTLVSALRAALVAVAATALGFFALSSMRGASMQTRNRLLAAAAVAFFSPTMLSGYGWLPVVARWPAGSSAREWFYGAALLARFSPVAVVVLWLANPGPSPAGARVWRIAGLRSSWFRRREAGAAPWLAAALVFLLAFQEFDLATSWGMRAWSVALFDAQIGGLAVTESLRLAALPFAVQAGILLPLVFRVARMRRERLKELESDPAPIWPAALVCAAAPLMFHVAGPAFVLFRSSADAFRAWWEMPAMISEIGRACLSAGIAASLAWTLSAARFKAAAVLALPGLLGPLLLALTMFALSMSARPLLDTVVPWLAGLTLSLVPVAMLFRVLLDRGTDGPALHAGRLARASAAPVVLNQARNVHAWLFLFCLGYGDFTLSTILAPPQFTTVFPRVFNLMHYGQSAVLSFSVMVAVLLPLAAVGLTLFASRLYVRLRVR